MAHDSNQAFLSESLNSQECSFMEDFQVAYTEQQYQVSLAPISLPAQSLIFT